MNTKVINYRVIVQKEGTNFISHVPTLGISDFGKTLDETLKNTQHAISCHIQGLIKTKSDIPNRYNFI